MNCLLSTFTPGPCVSLLCGLLRATSFLVFSSKKWIEEGRLISLYYTAGRLEGNCAA